MADQERSPILVKIQGFLLKAFYNLGSYNAHVLVLILIILVYNKIVLIHLPKLWLERNKSPPAQDLKLPDPIVS